ncbi:MAG TPA: ATP-binding protein [Terriglobia bacterium]|nr:ATP-binding protein [Terriglobia bacterium]
MRRIRLRTKLLFSLVFISSVLACATVFIVRLKVEHRVRENLNEALHNSVATFQNFRQQREAILGRSVRLLADLPELRALMTTQDSATIQDGSTDLWKLAGSRLFVLADRSGKVVALHAANPGFSAADAQEALSRSLQAGETRDWWYGNGRLYDVFLQPIYFGRPSDGLLLGVLGVGYEVGTAVAKEVSQVASSQVVFRYGKDLVVTALPLGQEAQLRSHLDRLPDPSEGAVEIKLGGERFVATSVQLPPAGVSPVSLTVLKSYDRATQFLQGLNRWLFGVGLAAILAGIGLAFLMSHTVTRPLENLVSGLRALEKGDFEYPLLPTTGDEVGELTAAFHRMRDSLRTTQNELLHAERLATMGRMASAISHDLRHPLTAILAYAEFLSEGNLPESQRKDFYEEIRQAVNRMSELISSLLELSKARKINRPVLCSIEETVRSAIQDVQARHEFRTIGISVWHEGEPCQGWFDPIKLERVFHNLLLNACEAVSHESGLIEVRIRRAADGFEVRMADNGPGIPEHLLGTIFQPFVSYGKENGTGLGLAVVHKMIEDHGGAIFVEHTGSTGTVFRLTFPSGAPPDVTAQV